MDYTIYTKNLLADALLEEFKNKDLDQIRVGEICDKCGLARKTFYNHFQDKYDLMYWIMLNKLHNAYKRDFGFKANLDQYLSNVLSEKNFYNRLFSDPGTSSLLDRIVKANLSSVAERVKMISQKDDISLEMTFHIKFYIYGCIYMFRDWIHNGFRVPVDDFARQLYDAAPDIVKLCL